MSTRRTLGLIGVALTCPCHAIPLLLVGGGAGSAWLAQYLGVAMTVLEAAFLFSLWLLLRPRTEVTAGRENAAPLRPDRR